MPALVVADEPLGLVRESEQPFAQRDRDHVVARAMHDQQRRPDGADPFVRMELVEHQPADGHEGEQGGGDVDSGGVGRLQDHLSDRLLGRQPDRDPGAERMAPQHDALGRVAGDRERIGRLGVAMQAILGRTSGRSRVTAVGQRDQPGAIGAQRAMALDPPCHDLGIAVEIDHHRHVAARRDVPDDHLLAVAGVEHHLLGFRQAGLGRLQMGRDRVVQHGALRHDEHAHQHHIAASPEDEHSFDDRHGVLIAQKYD